MRNLTATLCLTLAVLFGSAGTSWGADCTRQVQHQAGKDKDFNKYKKISMCMAKQNKAYGFHGLGFCARSGRCDGKKDLNAAVKYYTRAAEMGLWNSQFWLTVVTVTSKNLQPNYKYFTSLTNNPRVPKKAKDYLLKIKKSSRQKPTNQRVTSNQVEYKIYPDRKPLGSLASSQEMCNLLRHPIFQRPLDQFGLLGSMNGTPHWNTTKLASQWLSSRVRKFRISPMNRQWRLFSDVEKIANNRLSNCLKRLSSTSPRTYLILQKKFLKYLRTKPKCFEQSYRFKDILGDDGKIRKVKVFPRNSRKRGCINFNYDGASFGRWGSTTFQAMLTLKEAHSAFKTILDNGEQALSQRLSSSRSEQKIKAKQKKGQTKKKEEKLLKAQKSQQKLKRFWRKYQNREKSLVEQVLNYTLTNQLKGDLSAFWVSDKKNPCVLQIYGTQVGSLKTLGVIKKNKINIRKINQTGFVINREHKQINWIYKAAWYFVLKSGPIIYFQVATSHVDGMRLRKAWRLAFKECPGKRSKF